MAFRHDIWTFPLQIWMRDTTFFFSSGIFTGVAHPFTRRLRLLLFVRDLMCPFLSSLTTHAPFILWEFCYSLLAHRVGLEEHKGYQVVCVFVVVKQWLDQDSLGSSAYLSISALLNTLSTYRLDWLSASR